MTKKVCTICTGFGYTRATKPVVVFRDYIKADGRPGKQHVTKAQGSGCPACLGKVVTQCDDGAL